MFAKFKILLLVVSLLLPVALPANASFSDNFDSEAYTSDNWDVLLDSWNRVDLGSGDWGYHGINDVLENPAAASFADNQQYYYQTNLSMESLLKLDGNESDKQNTSTGFVVISGDVETDDYFEYTVLLEINYDDDPNNPDRELNVWSNSITPTDDDVENLVGTVPVSINFDTFYLLKVSTNTQDDIDVELYNPNDLVNPLYILPDIGLDFKFDSGMIGLATTDEATFNNFSITGNAVPIPGAVWLLGSGLIGLVGIRKKLKK
jgi:hypothetical protein